jgi:hypothetical protein
VSVDDAWTNYSASIASWEPPQGFCDHNWFGGLTEEDVNCVNDSGLVSEDVQQIYDGYISAMDAIRTAVINNGGFAWQFFTEVGTPSQSQCTSFYRTACSSTSEYQENAIMYSFMKNANGSPVPLPNFSEDLASFLLIRGPYAWLGYGWVGCDVNYEFPAPLTFDYGVPQGICSETVPGQSGIFTRQWSKANITVNCNTFDFDVAM